MVCDGIREVTGATAAISYVHFHRYATTAPTILQAAIIAERKLKGGGDYGNDPLKTAVAILVFVFDTATGGLPAFSRLPIGPVGKGSQRTIARSPCAPFIFAFFRYVDPALTEAQISNVLEARLALNRHLQKVDPPYFKGLPNLL
jgi:hypothetical protein